MKTHRSRIVRFLSSPRLVVVLLVLIGALAILGTVVPQQGVGIEGPLSAALSTGPLASVAQFLGLHSLFSSPFFLVPVVLLLASTCVCTLERLRIARSRHRFCSKLMGDDDDDVGMSMSSEEQQALAAGLQELEFGRITQTDRSVVGSASLWALYASPLFHILLVAVLAVLLAGRMTRMEALMVAPYNQARTISADNLAIDTRGLLHRFNNAPPSVIMLGMERNYLIGGQDHGIAAELALKTAQGKIVVRQTTYVNRPLSYRSTMMHVADLGYGLRFTHTSDDGQRAVIAFSQLVGDPNQITTENANEMFTPAIIALNEQEGTSVIFQPMPTMRDGQIVAGRKDEAFGVVARTDSGGTIIAGTIGELHVGQSIELPGGTALRFEGIENAVQLKVVDDWSVVPLTVLTVAATLALAVALLFSPRICAVSRKEGSDELTIVTRLFRPYSVDVSHIEKRLQQTAKDKQAAR